MKLFNGFVTVTSVFLLATLLGCAATPQQAGAGEHPDGIAIARKVQSAIFEAPSLQTAVIDVGVVNGKICLSGFVDDIADIQKADEVAYNVAGVTSVKNEILIR